MAQVLKGLTPVASYFYDYRGLRTRKVVGSTITLFHYDQGRSCDRGKHHTGTILRTYIWRDDTPYIIIDSSSGTDVVLYLEVDSLNTPRVARDANGKSSGLGTRMRLAAACLMKTRMGMAF